MVTAVTAASSVYVVRPTVSRGRYVLLAVAIVNASVSVSDSSHIVTAADHMQQMTAAYILQVPRPVPPLSLPAQIHKQGCSVSGSRLRGKADRKAASDQA